jgi:hypothetical protein
MSRSKKIILLFLTFCAGILAGGYLFSRSQPRSILTIHDCRSCLNGKDLLGLLSSVGIQRFSALMPQKVCETDKTIAMKIPFTGRRTHYVIVPKKDIQNMGEISESNKEYFMDALLVARWIIEQDKLSKYQFYTNGPGSQQVSYLHFHLVSE